MTSNAAAAAPRAGIGLKPLHVDEILRHGAAVDFFEVHAENYMVAGGPFLRHLEQVRARWPLSIHGVGLSIGADGPLDARHLDRLAALVQRFEPHWVSEHLAWSSHDGRYFNDLLPLPYNAVTLNRVCDHIDQVQYRLKRRLLLENPSTYIEFVVSTMSEAHFLVEVQRRTGCELLLDVNNAFVSAINHARDPWTLIESLPDEAIGEIHLAGFAEDRDAAGNRLLIDHHGSAIDESVWALYERTVERLGPRPTLIERDNELPALAVLEEEASQARTVQRAWATARRTAA
jgi:uncharacterized protein (UPF0276 family)